MMNVYNNLTSQVEPFVPQSGKKIYWYICGPTVYDYSHLGHARTYLTADILRRIWEHFGYEVIQIMNITNIDDKIIAKAQGKDFREIADYYEQQFWDDMKMIGVQNPDIVCRVSDYISEIIAFISRLIEKQFAYVANGSVYFDLERYRQIGGKYHFREFASSDDLSKNKHPDKKNHEDFVLWKYAKLGEPSWESPWGKGRPGWHIECSTMAIEIMKTWTNGTMDVHSGGIDLCFPHHENEIIQSTAYLELLNSSQGESFRLLDEHISSEDPVSLGEDHGRESSDRWAQYFLHMGHLNIDGLKMSKSLKNFIRIRDCPKPEVLRMLFLLHRYNRTMNYNDTSLQYAERIVKRFTDFFAAIPNVSFDSKFKWSSQGETLEKKLRKNQDQVNTELQNDFNTPEVIRLFLELIDATFQYISSEKNVERFLINLVHEYLKKMYLMLGFSFNQQHNQSDSLVNIIKSIRSDIRCYAKKYKELYALSDKIRDAYVPELHLQD